MASTIAAGKKIRREYIRVFSVVARAIRDSKSKIFLEERARGAFPRQELFDFILGMALDGRAHAARLVADINKRYIFDALDKVPGHGLSKDKIAAMFDAGVKLARVHNSKASGAVKNAHHGRFRGTGFSTKRHLRDGGLPFDYTFRFDYSLSKSVWNTVNHTEEKILNVVWGAIAQGRDIRSVSTDLMAYVRQGPTVIPGRWGSLKPGTAEYVRRFGKAGVDYRAIRIYRSEMYRNLQEEAAREAKSNPAFAGLFDWVRFPGGIKCVPCDDNVADSPYAEDAVPAYPHPNCMCSVRPRLKDHDDFINELRAFVNGEPDGEAIGRWAAENGLTENPAGTASVVGDTISPAATVPAEELSVSDDVQPTNKGNPLTDTELADFRNYLVGQKENMPGVSAARVNAWAGAIAERMKKLPPRLQHLIKDLQVNITTRGTDSELQAFFSNGTIHIKPSWIANSDVGMNAFFHEMGHAIDFLLDSPAGNPSHKINFRADYDEFIRRAAAMGRLTDKNMRNALSGYSKSGISDMFFGLSNGRWVGDYGHPLSYYTNNSIREEGFSHIIRYLQDDRDLMRHFFPQAHRQFMDWLAHL